MFHREMLDGIYHIGDERGNFCTLVTGSRGAILFDTMAGFDDLKSYVENLTSFAPIVINSHCHFDHVGGNHQFDRVHMSREEFPLLELSFNRIPTLTRTLDADLSVTACCYTDLDRIHTIEPGTLLDLGNRTAEVIALPGHTPGSIGLLLREDRLLLAGDALSPQYCIFFRESLPLDTNRTTIHGLWTLPFDRFLTSHFDILFEKEIIRKFEACFDLVGKKRGMDYVYEILPEEHGRFFVLTPCDPEIHTLIGLAVKEEDAPVPPKKNKESK